MEMTGRTETDGMRGEYKRPDFPKGFARGKYAGRLRESSNVVVLEPEVARAFPNQEAVNDALLSLIRIAEKAARLTRRSVGRVKTRRAG